MGLFGSFLSRFKGSKPSPTDLAEFRELLIASDIGPTFTEELIAEVSKERSEDLTAVVKSKILSSLRQEPREIKLSPDGLTTILIVGVNGTGKTTSAAKLAHYFTASGKKVILAAADTFRAAAVEQLQTWGRAISVPVVSAASGADPASVAFEAATRARSEGADVLIIDTAGRLHTKSNLMDELGKIRRVVEKVTPISEVLFVLDGTTGQNGISQARVFSESAPLTGIVVTKVDGSTKGGIALATERELGVPIRFVGTGEKISDISLFDPELYVSELLTQS